MTTSKHLESGRGQANAFGTAKNESAFSYPEVHTVKRRVVPAPRGDYQLYELLKADLTSKARNAREYELAVREAARLAGV